MQPLDFIYQRHSVRKFKNQDVDPTHLQEMIKAAIHAPSGKNVQNWHFVVLNNKEKIQDIVKIVEKQNDTLASWTNDENLKKEILKFKSFHTVFRGAPSLVFVFAGPYRDMAVDAYKARNASSEEIHSLLRVAPAIQNISAALENLMLTAAALGYGTCWMTGPAYAFNEIHQYLGFEKEGYFLAAMTPLGVPEEKELSSPPRKSIDEILTIID
ncbi:nitroreductase family protein [Geosporobacter ferrireducens]|uniref:Nitroreductase n=1 Tax=Geosporobacter ferrireducens TaxID=1424294 RepID=A0A1D8GCE4_9FIRM|nr:nitroreductase family protein [Geosporobacter ferrireducens]AOT68585.1 nitroreductase [Geosporobacter ferrireducens]